MVWWLHQDPAPAAQGASSARYLTIGASGIVIGRTNLPLVTEGEALYHIARFGQPKTAAALVQQYRNALDPDEAEDTDELVIQ